MGYYETVDSGPRHQVKHLCVKVGERLSLQTHSQRAEHWVVVSGVARVSIGEKIHMLHADESCYIPIGAKHSLENVGQTPLSIIEVQSGAYLGEDDIVRLEDKYNRKEK